MEKLKDNFFPNYFSESVCNEICKHGKGQNILVYRVGKYGNNDKNAFLNYYEEVVEGLKVVRNKEKYLEKCRHDIDRLSVSCYENIEDIEDYYKLTLKDTYPQRILLQGETQKEHGLSGRTKERKSSCVSSHVDWWLFDKAKPWIAFKEVEI